MKIKIGHKHLTVAILSLGGILIVYGALRGIFGPILPKDVDTNLPNVVIFIALAIFLYNRKLRSDEAKARAEKEKAASEAAAIAEDNATAADDPDQGERGRDEGGMTN